MKTLFLSRDEIDFREFLKDHTPVAIAARSSDLRLYVGAEIKVRIRIKDQRLKNVSWNACLIVRKGCKYSRRSPKIMSWNRRATTL